MKPEFPVSERLVAVKRCFRQDCWRWCRALPAGLSGEGAAAAQLRPCPKALQGAELIRLELQRWPALRKACRAWRPW